MSPKKDARKSTASASGRSRSLLSAEERAAMAETLRERKRALAGANGEADVLAKIAEMPPADRVIAERLHAIVKANAPNLTPRTWYGMPAYARDGDVICFFQSGHKFKSRYATFGFNQGAKLDDGDVWATSFALTKLTPAVEEKMARLIKKAAG